jgi:hypothetical protein
MEEETLGSLLAKKQKTVSPPPVQGETLGSLLLKKQSTHPLSPAKAGVATLPAPNNIDSALQGVSEIRPMPKPKMNQLAYWKGVGKN